MLVKGQETNFLKLLKDGVSIDQVRRDNSANFIKLTFIQYFIFSQPLFYL